MEPTPPPSSPMEPPPPSLGKSKQVVEREPDEASSLLSEIHPGNPVDCALKQMEISMKGLDPIDEVGMIKSFWESVPRPSHESIDNVLIDQSKVDISNDKVDHVKARHDWLFENDPDNAISLLESESVSKPDGSSINRDQAGPVFSTLPIANFRGGPREFYSFNRPWFPTHLQQQLDQPPVVDSNSYGFLGTRPEMNREGPREFHGFNPPPPPPILNSYTVSPNYDQPRFSPYRVRPNHHQLRFSPYMTNHGPMFGGVRGVPPHLINNGGAGMNDKMEEVQNKKAESRRYYEIRQKQKKEKAERRRLGEQGSMSGNDQRKETQEGNKS